MNFNSELAKLRAALKSASSKLAFFELRSRFIAKNSLFLKMQKELKNSSVDKRKVIGQSLNEYRLAVTKIIDDALAKFTEKQLLERLHAKKVAMDRPGNYFRSAFQNPLYKTLQKVQEIFAKLNYDVQDWRRQEVDSEENNFTSLNIPENHPSREMHDTFYLQNNFLLRTHCTNLTVHSLKSANNQSEIRRIFYGNVYRKDDDDATHSHQFMQIDGYNIGENITFANLKWTLLHFSRCFFGENTRIRLRPSYFPFTEPSTEVDVNCVKCDGKGCSLCKNTGWIEILGAGMLHPNVFRATGQNSDKLQGFAFGIGVERLAMLRYGITDIRAFYQNDIRFLQNFGVDKC